MSPRSLFNVILKILGIFFIKDILSALPQLLSVIFYLTHSDTIMEGIWTLLSTVFLISFYCLMSYYLIFRSDFIIDKFKLDRGFDQEVIPLNIHRSTILSISVLLIGGLILADEIPNFCRRLFDYYQEKRMTHGLNSRSISYIVLAAFKIIIGYLLLAEQRRIVNFIAFKSRHTGSEESV